MRNNAGRTAGLWGSLSKTCFVCLSRQFEAFEAFNVKLLKFNIKLSCKEMESENREISKCFNGCPGRAVQGIEDLAVTEIQAK